MANVLVKLERLYELTDLLHQMSEAALKCDNKKFWELTKKFDDTQAIHKLEDSLNRHANHR